MIVSFHLTMPNVGSWDGKWSGADKKYYIIKNISTRYLKSREYFKVLLEKNKDSWYYRWNDGWGANVTVEMIDSAEARKRRKQSAGFCGYEWMIESIIYHGKILSASDKKVLQTE